MTGKIVKFGVALLVTAAVVSTVAVRAADSPDSIAKRRMQRKAERHRMTQQRANEVNRAWVQSRTVREGGMGTSGFNSSIIGESTIPRGSFSSSGAVPPAPSPGQDIGFTSYDYQANNSQAYNIARKGNTPGDKLHFTWMAFKYIPTDIESSDRFVLYNEYTDADDYPNMDEADGGVPGTATYNGVELTGANNRGGYCNIDVDMGNHAHIGMHQSENDYNIDPYQPWHVQFPFPDDTYQLYGLGGYDVVGNCPGQPGGIGGVLWPRIGADRSSMILHEIAHSNVNDCATEELWYWRFDGIDTWSGPSLIGDTEDISYAIAVDDVGQKLAVVTHQTTSGFSNVAYVESANNGTDWLALVPNVDPLPTKNFITDYSLANGDFTAWLHLTATYDNQSVLHVVWDEQENAESEHIALKHWNSQRGTARTIALGYWDRPVSTGVFNLNLTKPSLGIGDGGTLCQGGADDNEDYVYVTYVQFGGNTALELSDYSDEASVEGRAGGYMNGELYLAISNTSGNTWSPPVNLTNTKTPGCNPGLADLNTGIPANPDGVCRSEHWATVNRVVSDLDIFFVSDLDAGGIPQGEGSWQLNPIHYLQFAGGTTDAVNICPVIAPVFEAVLSADPLCEYNAPRAGQTSTTLRILNLGNATLNQGGGAGIVVTDFPGLPTLEVDLPVGAYSIPAGDPDIVKTVTMKSMNAAENLYIGQISISHNDANPNNPSPRLYPVEFFVFDIFDCPEAQMLKTGVNSPGSLQLAVETTGRFGAQEAEGQLWRHTDSSSSFFDASLLMAHGTQGPTDTTVFLRFFDRLSNGQNGWRAQSELFVDTATYTTGAGYARAGAYMSTRDSVMGVNMSWYFPQGASGDEVVIVNYLMFPGPNWNGAATISGVTSGILVDIDVLPAQRNPLDTAQTGVNNHGIADDPRNLAYARGTNKAGYTVVGTNTAERFRAGIAVPTGMEGAYIGDNGVNQTGGGPTDGALYQLLQTVAGAEVGETSDTDLFIIVGLDKGQAYAPIANRTWRGWTVKSHTAVLASDTVDDVSFLAAVDAAAVLVNANTFDGCVVCPCRYDPACDGDPTVLDVVHVVGGAFRNILVDPAGPSMSACNFDSRDVDASGVIDVLDVVKMVGVAFRNVDYINATPATPSFVDPCTKFREWN